MVCGMKRALLLLSLFVHRGGVRGGHTLFMVYVFWQVYLPYITTRGNVIRKERERAKEKELAQAKEIEKAYEELKSTQVTTYPIRKNGFAWMNLLQALHMRYKTR